MKTQKARNMTAPMKRAIESLTNVDDPCQLGGLQGLLSDKMTDCRLLDPGQGKYPQSQGEIRPWYDAVIGYQRMSTKAHKSKNRSGHPHIKIKTGKPSTLTCYATKKR